jgi:hypothetical protein
MEAELVISEPGRCPDTGAHLRIEHHDDGITAYCHRCGEHHKLCLNQKYMMYCQKLVDHGGRHAYRTSDTHVQEWE